MKYKIPYLMIVCSVLSISILRIVGFNLDRIVSSELAIAALNDPAAQHTLIVYSDAMRQFYFAFNGFIVVMGILLIRSFCMMNNLWIFKKGYFKKG